MFPDQKFLIRKARQAEKDQNNDELQISSN